MTDPATDALALARAVEERLRALVDPNLVPVLSVLDRDAVQSAGQRRRIVVVAPATEQPVRTAVGEDDGPGHAVTSTVHVLSVVATRNAPGGADAVGRLRTSRDIVRTALAGWVPEHGAEPLRYAGGRLIDPRGWFGEGLAVWQDAYAATGWWPWPPGPADAAETT